MKNLLSVNKNETAKRILFILPSLRVGGMERVLVTISNRLVRKGYDVTVITLAPAQELRSELDGRVRFIYRPYKQHLGSRIPYIRYKYYDDGMWETRASAKELYRYYVGRERYDVEIAFFRGLCVKIISGSDNPDSVKLAWVHSDFSKAENFKNNFRSFEEVAAAYRSFDRIVCVSRQAADGFRSAVGITDSVEVIYNLLPADEIREKAAAPCAVPLPKAKLRAVVAGHYIDSTKGQSRLIGAVCRLREEGFDVSLALVGRGKDQRMFADLIAAHKAEDYVMMLDGGLNPYPYIKSADLLVCSSYYEGYNLTVAEALILGTPVLSTDCTGPREILDGGKYGMIVENSWEGLYAGLKKLAQNPCLLEEYREKTKQRQDFFDEERILRQITDLF